MAVHSNGGDAAANMGLHNPWFRGHADHMASQVFAAALARVLSDADGRRVAVMCRSPSIREF